MKIVVAGGAGRMGRTLIEAITRSSDTTLAGALEVSGNTLVGAMAGTQDGLSSGIRITADFAGTIPMGDCLIDFTRPEGTLAHLGVCVTKGVRAVIGTTGFSAEQRKTIETAARQIPIVFAPNMAVGVNAALKLAAVAAKILGDDFDVEIIEAHHRHKVDAPSGTALRLGEMVAQALGRDLGAVARHGRLGVTGERDTSTIGFHAIRGGDIVGEHTVIFAGEGERVEVTVRSQSRMTYALGALRACRFLMGMGPGLYDMQDVLGLR
ncbi:MAG: 4-hydroxy-tetrahydrodipicolinate reductase [Betaproteobacteria bacterium]|nr:4-hydroxy-tetrahydrodipicolinate reductase [Betaproteobacteria bacterium]